MTSLSKNIGTSIALTSLLLLSSLVSAVAPTPSEPEGTPPVPVDSMLTTSGSSINKLATVAQIYGNWKASLVKKDPSSGNLISMQGTVQYKNGNAFSAQIEVKISGMKAKVPFSLTYKLWTKGTWEIKNNILTETITDVTSVPTMVQSGEKTINIAALAADKQAKVIASLPNMDAIFPKNVPEASKVLSVSANKLTINSDGEILVLTRVTSK